MKKQTLQLFKSLVVFFGIMLSCIHAKSQTPSDFWMAFEACSQVQAFQSHYPSLTSGLTRTHAVMNHGVSVPTVQGVSFAQIAVELYDKSTMLGLGKTNFFLFHDVKIEGNQAMFDMVYYYNFNGSYDQFVAATIKLTKTNGVWAITETKIN
jgi:hypothetical protein